MAPSVTGSSRYSVTPLPSRARILRSVQIHGMTYLDHTIASEQPPVLTTLNRFRTLDKHRAAQTSHRSSRSSQKKRGNGGIKTVITRQDFVALAVVYPRLHQLGKTSQERIVNWCADNWEVLEQWNNLEDECPGWFNSEETDAEQGIVPRKAGLLDPAMSGWVEPNAEPVAANDNLEDPEIFVTTVLTSHSSKETSATDSDSPEVVILSTPPSSVFKTSAAEHVPTHMDIDSEHSTEAQHPAAISAGKQPVTDPVSESGASSSSSPTGSVAFAGTRRRHLVSNGPVALLPRSEIEDLLVSVREMSKLTGTMLSMSPRMLPMGLYEDAWEVNREVHRAERNLEGYWRRFEPTEELTGGTSSHTNSGEDAVPVYGRERSVSPVVGPGPVRANGAGGSAPRTQWEAMRQARRTRAPYGRN